jgi:diguanylate cyclase (GGDEF)-like protein
VLARCAQELGSSPVALAQACNCLQLSVEFSLVRMSRRFDDERRRIDDELKSREEELAFMATHDVLTGLPNRMLILDRAKQMLARCRRERSRVVALFVDIDNFKTVNDTLGHAEGDRLLRSVAARLDGIVRPTDALGRLGGDEFVMVCELSGVDPAPEPIAERLLETLRAPFKLGEEEEISFAVAASVGVAVGDRGSAEELLREADIAMYNAKWDGKSTFAVFEASMRDTIELRNELEKDLCGAVERGELFLVYQPTFALSDMTPTGVEALVRWKHPLRGILEPDEFIPIAEDTGMIVDIGRWVLRQACAQCAAWHAAGYEMGMAVNVSARQLDTDELVRDIEETLGETQLDAQSLTLEITETALTRNVEQCSRRLHEIKRLGVRIAVDDFGTGYSSLSLLRQFPVDALKIDRSFISSLSEGREGEAVIQTLVQLGKALSLETLAEGIEDQQQLSALRLGDCDSGQGFLFARPLDAAAAEAFILSHMKTAHMKTAPGAVK